MATEVGVVGVVGVVGFDAGLTSVCMSTNDGSTNWHATVARHPRVQLPASAPLLALNDTQ